jgi:hypothetical protein
VDAPVDCTGMLCWYVYIQQPYVPVTLPSSDNYAAIMIGCSPVFAVFIRKRLTSSKKASYNAHGYIKQTTNENIKMRSMVSATREPECDSIDAYWVDAESSQEELAKNAGHIVVKTTVHQNDEPSHIKVAGSL